MEAPLWKKCLARLEGELPEQQFNTWIRPLQAIEEQGALRLLAPNRFVLDWVRDHFMERINDSVSRLAGAPQPRIQLEIGSHRRARPAATESAAKANGQASSSPRRPVAPAEATNSSLNRTFTFGTFVEGKSNQLAKAASIQVGENPGGAYNPLFIYGGVGLGKTHLMHAVGNLMLERKPNARSFICIRNVSWPIW